MSGLPTPDAWEKRGPHPGEPAWRVPILGTVTVLHDDHAGVLIDGQWVDADVAEVREMVRKLSAVAEWLAVPVEVQCDE